MAVRAHGTLTSNTVATKTLTASSNTIALSTPYGPDEKIISDGISAVRVTVALAGSPNAGVAYVTVDGTEPTVAGDDTYAVVTGPVGRLIRVGKESTVTVKIISTATLTYAVEAE